MSCEELKIVDKMGRPPCCDKSNVKKGLWTAEEDMKLLAYVSKHGPGNWTAIPKKAGLKRCGKSCRLRWTNYLRPDLRHEGFTQEEEQMIIILHATIGSRWSHIAAQLPGRTDNDVKNYWNTKLRKKLREMGIDPVTHKPFSQVIADYGNIGLPRVTTPSTSRIDPSRSQTSNITRISCLNRDLRNAFMPKPTPSQSLISNFSLSTSMTTEMLPTQDSLLNNQYPTWDLFAQIQAIKLVADASNSCNNQETLQSHFSIEGSSPSSSSSSSSSSISSHQHSIQTAAYLPLPSQPYQAQSEDTPSPSSFNWSEYLSEDAFQQDSSSNQLQDDMFSPIPKLDFIGGEKNQYCNGFADVDGCAQVVHGYNNNMMGGDPTDILGADSENSFVESILDRDSEMLWEFPDILDDP